MKKDSGFVRRMRAGEYFHDLRLLPAAWVVLRLDGHGFTKLTNRRFNKPFDEAFHDHMIDTSRTLLERFGGLYAYTESDEVSLLLPRAWSLFDRGLEKAISLSAGLAGAEFTRACGEVAPFDARAWAGARDEDVVDDFRWRQGDAARGALNGWCYWTLRRSGRSASEATAALHGKPVSFKNELLFSHGINFNEVPLWQRRGTGLYWESYHKEGHDPVRDEPVRTSRRRVKVDRELPMGCDYDRLILQIMGSSEVPADDGQRRRAERP